MLHSKQVCGQAIMTARTPATAHRKTSVRQRWTASKIRWTNSGQAFRDPTMTSGRMSMKSMVHAQRIFTSRSIAVIKVMLIAKAAAALSMTSSPAP